MSKSRDAMVFETEPPPRGRSNNLPNLIQAMKQLKIETLVEAKTKLVNDALTCDSRIDRMAAATIKAANNHLTPEDSRIYVVLTGALMVSIKREIGDKPIPAIPAEMAVKALLRKALQDKLLNEHIITVMTLIRDRGHREYILEKLINKLPENPNRISEIAAALGLSLDRNTMPKAGKRMRRGRDSVVRVSRGAVAWA